jgi:hypothetical protein
MFDEGGSEIALASAAIAPVSMIDQLSPSALKALANPRRPLYHHQLGARRVKWTHQVLTEQVPVDRALFPLQLRHDRH